jgi:uroporphyrinogen decarboxylase
MGKMTSLQRVLTTLGHKEPDRVPFFLLLTLHGAKELGLSIRNYFSRAENVAQGQLRLRDKYRDDCIYSFFHAALEAQAFGGEVIFCDDGPPNSGEPIIRKPEDISTLTAPKVAETACLKKVLQATSLLKAKVGDEVPIIGVVMAPFSLPVMQMGFEHYINLQYEQPDLLEKLLQVNTEFCVEWANAQLAAGATAICYFDPLASPTITPRKMYLNTGFQVACETLARINGPTATHMASGRCLAIVDDLVRTGTTIVGSSILEDLAEVKTVCEKKLTVLGNLNGCEMQHWTEAQADLTVKEAISKAASGGGFILSDNHGEIPWQVPENVLLAISAAVHKWGHYPLVKM